MIWAALLGLTAFQSPPQTGTFVGRVVDADTGEGLPQATVKLTPLGAGRERPRFGPRGSDGQTLPFPNQPPRPQTTSGDDGSFRLPAAPGDYHSSIELVGYVIDYASVDPSTIITLKAQQTLPALTVKLRKQAVITGRVFDQDGRPIAHAMVMALTPPRTLQGVAMEAASKATAQTNDLGEYRLAGLQPGKYLVSAGGSFATAIFGGGPSYETRYYPGVSSVKAAQSLDVAAGNTRSAIDFRLSEISLVSISGKVSPSGPGTMLTLQLDESGQGPPILPPEVSEAGEFTFPRVAPGDYTLTAMFFEPKPDQLSQPTGNVHLRLKVGDRPISGLLLTRKTPMIVTGRIVAPPNAALAGIGIFLRRERQNGPQPGNTRADANGRFSLSNIDPITYQPVVFDLPNGYYVKSITYGETAASETLNLEDGVVADLTITLDNGTAQLSGRVINQKKQPAVGTIVVLMNANQEVFVAPADARGEYLFADLAPGEYRLSTSATPNLFDPAVQAQLTQHGQKITLAHSAQETRQLEVK